MLNEYNKAYEDLEIIAINLTTNDIEATVLKFVEDNGYGYSMIMDLDGSMSSPYGIGYIPFIILIDKEGVIRYKGSAPSSVSGLRMLVNQTFPK